jgi:N-acetyl-gamma-glutamyl-phosphate reductase
MSKVQTAVIGATGYAGFELAKILLRHRRLHKPMLCVRENAAEAGNLADVYPHLAGNGGYPLEAFSWEALQARGVDLLFLATPHEISRAWAPEAESRGIRVVDLSGAWRLRDEANRAVYGFEDPDPAAAYDFTSRAVYGLPELHRDQLSAANIVANPGCYATSCILALAPLVRAGLLDLDHGIVCDAKSGVSGAGKQPTQKTHFVEVADNFQAYSVFNHRHTGEILEQLGLEATQLIFTPHLLPIPRGILSTIYVRLAKPHTAGDVYQLFRSFYAGSPFVRIFEPPRLPQVQFSTFTNYCDVGFALAPDGQRLIVIACLDNLLKGAAGQAVQNMNLMYGWSEQEALA